MLANNSDNLDSLARCQQQGTVNNRFFIYTISALNFVFVYNVTCVVNTGFGLEHSLVFNGFDGSI